MQYSSKAYRLRDHKKRGESTPVQSGKVLVYCFKVQNSSESGEMFLFDFWEWEEENNNHVGIMDLEPESLV